MVVIFGIHAVSEALKSGARSFDYVGVSRERHDQRIQRIIETCRASGIQLRFLPREELDRAAKTHTHQGVIAVTSTKQYADVDVLLENRKGPYSLVVVLDGIEDPHNLGALIRTADAMGADGVVFAGDSVDPYNGKCLRSSAGSIFSLPVVVDSDATGVVSAILDSGVAVLATALDATVDLRSADLSARTAWLFGPEAHGLPAEVAALASQQVSIPMRGSAESLNVAAAAAICLYESARAQS